MTTESKTSDPFDTPLTQEEIAGAIEKPMATGKIFRIELKRDAAKADDRKSPFAHTSVDRPPSRRAVVAAFNAANAGENVNDRAGVAESGDDIEITGDLDPEDDEDYDSEYDELGDGD